MIYSSQKESEVRAFLPLGLAGVGILSVLFCTFQVNAVTIEAASPGKATAAKSSTVVWGGDGVYTFRVKATPDGAAVNDTAAEQCLDILPGSVMTGIPITGWGALTAKLSYRNKLDFTVNLSNRCNYELRRYVALWDTVVEETFMGDWVTVPANRICSVNIVTSPAIPDLVPGKQVNKIQITSSSSGTGTLAFKPNANNGSRGVLSNGTHSLTYSVPDTLWDNTLNQWTGALADYFLKLDDIPDPTVAGVYTGNMTATISCE